MRTSTETLIAACRELAATVQCDDGVANMALREIAERLEELSRWIPITEKLPEHGEQVLFVWLDEHEFSFINYGWWEGLKTLSGDIAMEVSQDPTEWLPCTHWRPLPDLPEVKE